MSAPEPRTCVVATAGHVDHGKSTLVHALTGTDPDRLEGEKRRGLTIDLGFAEMHTRSGATIAFVDVPGHVRFIGNMLAGVGAVDAALFVVDAVEGWKPQSEEHLRILDLVGVERGIVVLTKAAKADAELLELTRMDVADRLAGSCLDTAPVLTVDALSGIGIDELRVALDRLVSWSSPPLAGDRARLWIDRSFVIEGAGAVVTGTLTGGSLTTGDEVAIVTRTGVREARIRRLQSFGRDCESVGPGRRTAVNLVGVRHYEVARGDALVHPGRWHLTRFFDASVVTLAGSTAGVGRRGALLLYVGSTELAARLRPFHGASIPVGEGDVARITLPTELPLAPGDRFVLRDVGRQETVGGGVVLDIDPRLPVSRAAPDTSVERVVRERGWVRPDELEGLTGHGRAPNLAAWIVDPDRLERDQAELMRRVEQAGSLGLDIAVLDERERAVLTTLADVVVAGGRARTAAIAAGDTLNRHPFIAALAAAPFQPPSPDEYGVAAAELSQLVRRGLVVEQAGMVFAPSAVDDAAQLVADLLAKHPEGVSVADAREAMRTTRKWAIPLLTLLDARGVTIRRGDVRLAGPRCPQQ